MSDSGKFIFRCTDEFNLLRIFVDFYILLLSKEGAGEGDIFSHFVTIYSRGMYGSTTATNTMFIKRVDPFVKRNSCCTVVQQQSDGFPHEK